jgi:hypothetical protein
MSDNIVSIIGIIFVAMGLTVLIYGYRQHLKEMIKEKRKDK